jgi:ribosomal protein L40E
MPANRPNLTLDEQSFQGLLSAAFIIQEHNDRLREAGQTTAEPEARLEPEANSICPHCGAPKPAEGSQCESCGLDEFRPGERLQHNWASMWLMSQEQRLWPERSQEIREGIGKGVPALDAERTARAEGAHDFAASGILALPVAKEVAPEPMAQEETATIHPRAPGQSVLGKSALAKATAEGRWITAATDDFPREGLTQEDLRPEDSDPAFQPFQLSGDDSYPTVASISIDDDGPRALVQRFADWHVKLRFHRADLYLGVAVFVAALALLWPVAGAPRPGALGPWERALVTLGIAEVPAPVVHLRGDPSLAVWVDPHTALYYCPGEEQYGKTADGRFSPQREAQMDRFEPAGRSACE